MVIFYVSDYQNTKKYIYQHTQDDLRSMGEMIVSSIMNVDDYKKIQEILSDFNLTNEKYEVLIVDVNSYIIAGTIPFDKNEKFVENSISRVLNGELEYAIAENFHDQTKVLDLTLPFYTIDEPEEIRGAIHIAQTIEAIQESLSNLKRNHVIYILITTILLSLMINILTYKLIIKKIKYLSRKMSLVEKGNLSEKVNIRTEDEFGQLGKIFNEMLTRIVETTKNLESALKEKNELYQRIQNFNVELQENIEKTTKKLIKTQQELIKKEKLATIGEMAAGLAHEIRNPLLIIEGSAEMLLKNEKFDDNAMTMLNDIVEEVERLNRAVGEILNFSKPVVPEYKKVEINKVIEDCLRKTIATIPDKDITQTLQFDAQFSSVYSDPELLRQVFINIFTNSIQAIKNEGTIKVKIKPENNYLVFEVQDTGEGIPEDFLPKIFDPFYSSKAGGIGLGLAIVKRIIETLKGDITVSSKPGEGTTFKIKLFNEQNKE